MSQILISCLQEIQDQHALPEGAKDKILQDFVDGDNLELELQGAISELKKGWQPAELTPFRELIATCIAKRDGKLKALQKGPKISAGQLEKQAFEVLLSSLQHDVDTYAVWKAKCLDRDSPHQAIWIQHMIRVQTPTWTYLLQWLTQNTMRRQSGLPRIGGAT